MHLGVISNTARNRSIVHYLIECAALEVTIRSKKMLWFIFCVVDLNKHRSYIDKPMTFENAFHLLYTKYSKHGMKKGSIIMLFLLHVMQ